MSVADPKKKVLSLFFLISAIYVLQYLNFIQQNSKLRLAWIGKLSRKERFLRLLSCNREFCTYFSYNFNFLYCLNYPFDKILANSLNPKVHQLHKRLLIGPSAKCLEDSISSTLLEIISFNFYRNFWYWVGQSTDFRIAVVLTWLKLVNEI